MVDARARVEEDAKKKKKEKVIAFIIRALPTKYKFYRGFSVSRPVKELNGGGKKERKKGRNIKKLGNIYIYIRANMNIHALTRGMRNDEKVVGLRTCFFSSNIYIYTRI